MSFKVRAETFQSCQYWLGVWQRSCAIGKGKEPDNVVEKFGVKQEGRLRFDFGMDRGQRKQSREFYSSVYFFEIRICSLLFLLFACLCKSSALFIFSGFN